MQTIRDDRALIFKGFKSHKVPGGIVDGLNNEAKRPSNGAIDFEPKRWLKWNHTIPLATFRSRERHKKTDLENEAGS